MPSMPSDLTKTVIPDVNFCNDQFPVLSFTYALFCEAEYREPERAVWRFSAGPRANYTMASLAAAYSGFLDYYTRGVQTEFPSSIRALVTQQVPMNTDDFVDERGAFNATPQQAEEAADAIMAELTGNGPPAPPGGSAAGRPGARKPRRSAQRPVLSCLAMIFLDEDSTFNDAPLNFLLGHELTAAERRTLLDFGTTPRVVLNNAEAAVLKPGLVLELQRFPSCW
jgi:hypothetical protein